MAKKSGFEDWRKQNYNLNVRVSNKTIDQLRAGKTFSGNVARFKKSGMTGVEREAMNRFYGKARVSAAFGNAVLKNPNTGVNSNSGFASSVPSSSTPRYSASAPKARVRSIYDQINSVSAGANRNVARNSSLYVPPTSAAKSATSKKAGKSFWSKAGGFVANELLGIDDFKRTANYVRKGQWGKAGKSLGEGALEFGTTVGAVAGAAVTGGGSLAARGALVAAKQAAKTGAKAAAKQTAKKASRAALREGIKTGATSGTVRGVASAAVKTVRHGTGAKFAVGSAVRGSKTIVGKGAGKVAGALERRVAPSGRTISKATNAAATATKGMNAAQKSKSTAYAEVRAMNKAALAAKAKRAAMTPAARAAYTAKAGQLTSQRVSAARKKSRSKSK